MSETRDETSDFFRGLTVRGRDPLLGKASGTLRFDLVDAHRVEHWHVRLHNGEVTVSRRNAGADAVVRADKELFTRIATGRENAMAALLRGAIVPHGDVSLLLHFARLFPGPPSAKGRRRSTRPRGPE